MATLVLCDLDANTTPSFDTLKSLHSWSQNSWILLFSHPDDFVRCDLELDRWISVAKQTFDLNRVRPLALATCGQRLDSGWVTQMTGDPRKLLMVEPQDSVEENHIQLNERQLRADILTLRRRPTRRRLVAIIDSSMVRRWTLAYDQPSQLPSPLDLARRVGVMRAEFRMGRIRADETAQGPSWAPLSAA